MNKAELVSALAEHLDGDRKTAAAAVDGLLDVIVRTVQAGDSVAVTGFGVFERRERAARTGRNPRTGQAMELPATAVPAFRPGATFRNVVSGARTPGHASAAGTVPAATAVAPVEVVPPPAAVAEKPVKVSGKGKPQKARKDGAKARGDNGKPGKDKAGKSAKAARKKAKK